MPNSSSSKNIIRGAAIGIGTIGLIAVLAISIVTLANINKNKNSNNDKVTVVNNNITVPSHNDTGVYNNTQYIYNNATLINYNSDVNFYYGNNETDQTTIFVYNNTEYIINNNFTDIQMLNFSETIIYNNTDNKYYYINNTEFFNFTEVLYYFFNGSDANEILNIYPNEPLNSEKYKEAAKLFSDAMDTSVNPCDDFYKYACGKYDKDMSFDIATDENYRKMAAAFNKVNDSDPLPIKQVKQMYHQCVIDKSNWGTITANGTFLKNLVQDFATQTKLPFPLLQNLHPVLPSPTLASTAIGYLSGKHGIDTLISQYIDTNNKDPMSDKPYMLILDQPALSYQWTYYIGSTWDYTKPRLTNRVEQMLAGYVNISGFDISPEAIDEAVEKIVEFEYVLANNYSTDAKTRWQSSRSYNLIKVQDFNATYSSFSIKTYLQQIAQNADAKVNKLITGASYQIQIAEPGRLAQMSEALKTSFGKQFTPDIFGNYLYYRLLEGYKDYYPKTHAIEEDEFLDKYEIKRPLRGKPRFEGIRMPRSKRYMKSSGEKLGEAGGSMKSSSAAAAYSPDCVDDTVNYFQYANARVFIDKIWPSQSDRSKIRDAVNHIADTILVGMESMIDQLSWMKPESKKGAYSKIQYLVRNIAYPDWITVDASLTKYYAALDKDFMSGNYPEMLAYLNALNQRIAFDQLAMTNGTDRKDFLGPPGTVNAWYQPEMNSITFPAAILRQPFFDPDWPASVNYGAMGVIAGHELTHGFDSSGTQWDGFGQLLSWLDPESQQQFDNMTNCVINEYSGFCPLDEESYSPNCINGQQTVGENVADNGGIHAAFRAYRNTMNFYGPDPLLPGDVVSLLNHDQLFFLSFAQVWCELKPKDDDEYHQILVDPHSPSKFRVFGTIQNFPAFRSAFNCPVDSNSAPKDHCNVWISDVNITKEASAASVLNIRENPTIKADNNLYTKYSQAQAFFQASMNLSADPCNNFYEYACGAYNKTLGFTIYRNKNYDTMAAKYEQMLKGYYGDMKTSTAINKTLNFYTQCKTAIKGLQYTNNSLPQIRNGSVVKSVLDEFQSFTGYSFNWCDVLHINTDADPRKMAKALAFLSIRYGVNTLVNPFIDVNAYRDASYSSNYTLYLDQNEVTYDKSYYQPGAWELFTRDTLKNNIQKMFLDYTNSLGTECNIGALEYNTEAIIEFEHLLATNFSTDETTRRDYKRWVNPSYVKDIPYKFVDWITYIGELSIHSETYFADADIGNYLLNIAEKDPLAKLDAFISDIGVDVVIKYFYYRLLLSQNAFIYSPPAGDSGSRKCVPLYDETGHIGKTFSKHPSQKPSKDPFVAAAVKLNSTQIADIRRACAEDTLTYMQYANARVFTEALYKNAAERESMRNETKKIITSIKSSMQSMLDDLPWIANDERTQAGAREKIKNLQINVAFPDFIMNNTQLDAYHDMIIFDKYDDFFSMLKKLQIFNMYQNYKVLKAGTDVDRKDFLGPPGTVNAWYQPEQNSITIPEGILQQPYFDPQWPASIKFGGLGLIVGHEITHGFDDQGVQWNGDGVLQDWMSDDSKAAFADMAECVVDEYGNFTVIQNTSYSPTKINGRQTQGENIADNGGIHAAYNSYLRWISLNGPDPQLPDRVFGQLTHEQIFFLAFAQGWCQPTPSDDTLFKQILIDPHSPSKFRIFGTIQNFPAFRDAYNCPVNSAYAPQNHCSVWVPKN